jgi:hypothetical protein
MDTGLIAECISADIVTRAVRIPLKKATCSENRKPHSRSANPIIQTTSGWPCWVDTGTIARRKADAVVGYLEGFRLTFNKISVSNPPRAANIEFVTV